MRRSKDAAKVRGGGGGWTMLERGFRSGFLPGESDAAWPENAENPTRKFDLTSRAENPAFLQKMLARIQSHIQNASSIGQLD